MGVRCVRGGVADRAGRRTQAQRVAGCYLQAGGGVQRRYAAIWPALWTFVTAEGVEPTNNAAERSLRSPVIHRKLSHGTRSEDGERFVERALSASVTCRLQGRSLFAYLVELLTARSRGQPLPALA